jgi:hypothetical protein
MEEQIGRFRELSRRLLGGRPGRSGWYPQELREVAVGCAQAAVAQGSNLRELAVALGVSHASLCRWVAKAKPGERGHDVARVAEGRCAPVHRVEIVPSEPAVGERSSGLVLVTPQGYRVEGLAVGDVARLLEVLR